MRVGIVGLGNFGRFVASVLAKDASLDVVAHDTSDVPALEGVAKTELAEVAASDAVILCVPLAAYDQLLPELRTHLRDDTLVVDVCSIKTEAENRIRHHLPAHQSLLMTHPMFGPQSAPGGNVAGKTLIVTSAEGEAAQQALDFCQAELGLTVMRMTNEEHDREMANVHALTFFVARGLAQTGLQESPFQAPSFQMLLNLVAFDRSHTEDLFRTIELGNPFAKAARERFVETLQAINNQLEKEKI